MKGSYRRADGACRQHLAGAGDPAGREAPAKKLSAVIEQLPRYVYQRVVQTERQNFCARIGKFFFGIERKEKVKEKVAGFLEAVNNVRAWFSASVGAIQDGQDIPATLLNLLPVGLVNFVGA